MKNIKTWQDRYGEKNGATTDMCMWSDAHVECMLAEIAEWRALAAQPPDPVQFAAEVLVRAQEITNQKIFEGRVARLMRLIDAKHVFDWPYTDAFDDGGVAYHEAKRRIEARDA